MAKAANDVLEKVVSLAKRRGFVFQSSEIYGGLNGCWDYGPLGVELLKNLKEEWWKFMTYRDDVEGLDASILMHPRVWEASGHIENFTDPMIDCKQCKARFRLDILGDALANDADDDFIGNQLAGVHEGCSQLAHLGALRARRPEHVPGRDVRDAEDPDDLLGLSALPRARRSE